MKTNKNRKVDDWKPSVVFRMTKTLTEPLSAKGVRKCCLPICHDKLIKDIKLQKLSAGVWRESQIFYTNTERDVKIPLNQNEGIFTKGVLHTCGHKILAVCAHAFVRACPLFLDPNFNLHDILVQSLPDTSLLLSRAAKLMYWDFFSDKGTFSFSLVCVDQDSLLVSAGINDKPIWKQNEIWPSKTIFDIKLNFQNEKRTTKWPKYR